jgi:hypothetical protein
MNPDPTNIISDMILTHSDVCPSKSIARLLMTAVPVRGPMYPSIPVISGTRIDFMHRGQFTSEPGAAFGLKASPHSHVIISDIQTPGRN